MPKRLKYRYHKDGTIPLPGSGEIFVYGSNLGGFHGAGAALLAKQLFGAEQLQGIGLAGRSYGIPTRDRFIRTLALWEIKKFVEMFVAYTNDRPETRFFVTRVGCGYAGYKSHQIAPLFRGCNTNCTFAHQWRPYLE